MYFKLKGKQKGLRNHVTLLLNYILFIRKKLAPAKEETLHHKPDYTNVMKNLIKQQVKKKSLKGHLFISFPFQSLILTANKRRDFMNCLEIVLKITKRQLCQETVSTEFCA